MLHNDAPRIMAAMETVPGVASVTRGWPKKTAKLPCVLVTLASGVAEDYRDDVEYLTELAYDVRIFARTAEQSDAVASAADDQMKALGYTRGLYYEEYGEDMRMIVLRYSKLI